MITFTVYDSTGSPVSGLASTITWLSYLNGTTGSPITPQPGFTEFGTSGIYQSDVDPSLSR